MYYPLVIVTGMQLVLLLVLSVALLGLGLAFGFLLRRPAPGPDPAIGVHEAMAHALAELQRSAVAQSEVAIRSAVEQASRLNRDVVGAQMAAGQQELLAKKELIDTSLDRVRIEVREELANVSEMVRQLGTTSTRSFGEVASALTAHAESTAKLDATAHGLREALASSKTRGQWGERMAEDVLRLAGFVEHVNYTKQTAVEGGRALPDFTFPMPKGHVLYMDVKFPLTSYLRFLESTNDRDKSVNREQFLRDVRVRVKELATRDYVRAGTATTIDYVLLFLPNESLSSFIHENDPALLDDAMRQKVVLCSPLTLFALLGVVRQAFDNFMIEQTSDQILKVLGAFEKEWGKFVGSVDTMGKRLESTQRAFEDLNGPRRRMLERSLVQLESLRRQRGLAVEPGLDLPELGDDGYVDEFDDDVLSMPPPRKLRA
jgi:DNA recombination protein RmuC